MQNEESNMDGTGGAVSAKMNIVTRRMDEIHPCPTNAKTHDQKQVDNVANCIRFAGWTQPIVVAQNGEIVIGHCRYLAARQLGCKEVPCLLKDELDERQLRALRVLDNKLNESPWDADLLKVELDGIDFGALDVDVDFAELDAAIGETEDEEYERKKKEFEERMAAGELDESDPEYQEFVKKFEAKKTTDDCYTPDLVYEAVAGWVANEYKVSRAKFKRPFYPGGDFQKEKYEHGEIVVDNPPFSILAAILDWYNENGIRYFLFAPHLTVFGTAADRCASVATGVSITYDNGANVNTSFVTNLESDGVAFRSAPSLFAAVQDANERWLKTMHKELPKYTYPKELVTSPIVGQFSRYGVDFVGMRREVFAVSQLDAQKESGKAIYGKGFLIGGALLAEREKAEREKAEREKATRWELSEREKAIIAGLCRQ